MQVQLKLLQYYTQHPKEILECPLDKEDFGQYAFVYEALKDHVEKYLQFDSVTLGIENLDALLALDFADCPNFPLGVESKLIDAVRNLRLNKLVDKAKSIDDLTELDKLRKPLRIDKPVSMKEGVHNFFEYFAETLDRKERTGTVGLPMNLRMFEENPLAPNTLFVLGARTSIGKTAFALNMAYSLAKNGGKVLYMSAEMDANSLLSRLYALVTDLPVSDFSNAENPQAVQQVFDLMTNLEGDIDIKYCGGWDWSKCKTYIIAQQGYDMVVFDHLHYLPIPYRANEVSFLTEAINDAKMIAGNMRNTFVMLAQVNRAAGDESEPPKVYHLRGSGGIEQGADIIGMLHRPDRGDSNGQICFAKNRGGQAGKIYDIWLHHKTLKLKER
jgi:replicative DNA helicase